MKFGWREKLYNKGWDKMEAKRKDIMNTNKIIIIK